MAANVCMHKEKHDTIHVYKRMCLEIQIGHGMKSLETVSMTQTVVGTFQDKFLWIECKFVFIWLMTEKTSFQLTVILPSEQFSTDKQENTGSFCITKNL